VSQDSRRLRLLLRGHAADNGNDSSIPARTPSTIAFWKTNRTSRSTIEERSHRDTFAGCRLQLACNSSANDRRAAIFSRGHEMNDLVGKILSVAQEKDSENGITTIRLAPPARIVRLSPQRARHSRDDAGENSDLVGFLIGQPRLFPRFWQFSRRRLGL